MSKQTILVVDDEPSICWAFEKMLTSDGHNVVTASSAEEGVPLATAQPFDLVVLDVRLSKEDGITALPKFLHATHNAPVIVITAFGDLETAVAAVKQGATDYLNKPFKMDDAARACESALRQSTSRKPPKPTQPMRRDNSELIGTSPAMQQAFRQIALVSESDLSVLITGETGTGKELVAAAIHRHGRRANAAYIPMAPVALHPDLIESELFGHVKGAFTGAVEDKAGLFERAEGGTVLLDEIGDLPPQTQVKLLRVLEQGHYARVGEVTQRAANVRILAATNCNLHDAVGRGDQSQSAIDATLRAALTERSWHGNIRELRNAIEHAAVVARGRPLAIEDFPPPKPRRDPSNLTTQASLETVVQSWTTETIASASDELNSLHSQFLAATEPALFKSALQHTGGNRAKAADLLGIHCGTLRDRLKSYRMDES